MDAEDLKRLQKAVRKAKRIASEQAMALHDLAEERLPEAYEELPKIAEDAFEACQAWAEANRQFKQAETEIEGRES